MLYCLPGVNRYVLSAAMALQSMSMQADCQVYLCIPYVLQRYVEFEAHMRRAQKSDLFVDSYTYNAHTTSKANANLALDSGRRRTTRALVCVHWRVHWRVYWRVPRACVCFVRLLWFVCATLCRPRTECVCIHRGPPTPPHPAGWAGCATYRTLPVGAVPTHQPQAGRQAGGQALLLTAGMHAVHSRYTWYTAATD
jgi:hypothetical protein